MHLEHEIEKKRNNLVDDSEIRIPDSSSKRPGGRTERTVQLDQDSCAGEDLKQNNQSFRTIPISTITNTYRSTIRIEFDLFLRFTKLDNIFETSPAKPFRLNCT
ncbi:hypothetical protein Trydic_g13050 [Trypoxylus dichotomus]